MIRFPEYPYLMTFWALAFLVVGLGTQEQERKPVPADSTEIVATGCLKGRVFTAVSRDADVARGPDVTGRSFRLDGPREVMNDVKKWNGQVVEVIGLVRTSALGDNAPGRRIGNTRVVIGVPPSTDPTTIHSPAENVVVMDVSSVRYVSDRCPIARR
jgi:hypothetical protein